MKAFSRKIQLGKLLGSGYNYESAEFYAEADTFAQAEKEVEDEIKAFIKREKNKTIDLDEVAGVKILKNTKSIDKPF